MTEARVPGHLTAGGAAGLGGLLVAAVTLSGCGLFSQTRSLEVSVDDVAAVELYEYPWGDEPGTVHRATVVREDGNDEVVAELVSMFTDMPTSRLSSWTSEQVAGKQALGVRYLLEGGSAVEVTRIFVGFHEVVVIWPDGEATATRWGSPDLIDYYGEIGVVEEVDADQRPAAEL